MLAVVTFISCKWKLQFFAHIFKMVDMFLIKRKNDISLLYIIIIIIIHNPEFARNSVAPPVVSQVLSVNYDIMSTSLVIFLNSVSRRHISVIR